MCVHNHPSVGEGWLYVVTPSFFWGRMGMCVHTYPSYDEGWSCVITYILVLVKDGHV